MKILVIRQANPFVASNATNNRFLSLAQGLTESGCDLDLLLLNGYFDKSEKLKYGRSGKYGKVNYEYLLPVDCSNRIVRQFFYRVFPMLFLYRKIQQILRRVEYDYIWLDFGPKVIQVSFRLLKENPDIKYFHERSEFSWIGLSQFKWLHKRYLNEFLPQIDVMNVMTRSLESYYKQFVGEKTKMIHLPMTVDFSRFNNIKESVHLKKPYIAYCGTMNNEKDGVDILIQSFIKIMDDFPEYRLYLAGPLLPKNDYKMQKALIMNAKCDQRILYIGALSKEEIPSFLMGASALALARPESKQTEGGFPTKLGEYLATGIPVCVTDVGEISQYLEHEVSAYIAEPGSVDSFSKILTKALTSEGSSAVGIAGKNVGLQNFNKDIQSSLLYNFLLENRL